MNARVVVLDYGSGNLRSAERALARVGADVTVTADLDAAGEQHLHADADAEDRAAALDAGGDHLFAADPADAGHTGGERADAGNDEPVGFERGVEVGGHRDNRTRSDQGPLGGPEVTRAVVENDDARSHRRPSAIGREAGQQECGRRDRSG